MKKLKRWIGILVIGIVLVAIGGRIGIGLMWKSAVERYGSDLTEVPVTVDRVWVSPLAGKIHVAGLTVGNPEGFKSSHAVKAQQVDLIVEWRSLFRDKTVIRDLSMVGVEVTYERALLKSNLGVLSKTVEEKTKSQEALVGQLKRRVQADVVRVEGGRVNLSATLLGGRGIGMGLPSLQLQNLGQNEEGITIVELASEILRSLLENVANLSTGSESTTG